MPTGLDELREAIASEPSIYGIIRQMMTTRLVFARRCAPLIKIILQEVPFHPELRAEFAQHIGVVRQQIDLIITPRIADGQVRQLETERLMRWLASMFVGYLFLSGTPGRTWDDAAELEAMADFVARGIAPD